MRHAGLEAQQRSLFFGCAAVAHGKLEGDTAA